MLMTGRVPASTSVESAALGWRRPDARTGPTWVPLPATPLGILGFPNLRLMEGHRLSRMLT